MIPGVTPADVARLIDGSAPHRTAEAQVWGDGKAAFWAQKPESDNPFPKGHPLWHEWNCGWSCGAREAAYRFAAT